MFVPGMRACLGTGSHASGLGFRRREVFVVTSCACTANVRIVEGGV